MKPAWNQAWADGTGRLLSLRAFHHLESQGNLLASSDSWSTFLKGATEEGMAWPPTPSLTAQALQSESQREMLMGFQLQGLCKETAYSAGVRTNGTIAPRFAYECMPKMGYSIRVQTQQQF